MKHYSLAIIVASTAFFQGLPASADTLTSNQTIAPENGAFDGKDIVVSNCTVTIDGTHAFNSLQIVSGGVLTHSPAANQPSHRISITVTHDVVIDASSRIDANGRGYSGAFPGPGAGGYGGHDGGGGGYGGWGAPSIAGGTAGAAYGSLSQPTDWGSQGGASDWNPGNEGGGAIRLSVGGTLTVNGRISANGNSDDQPDDQEGGAGSGGSIYLTVGTWAGNGTISVDGGFGDADCSGGGGGGRIAIYYDNRNFSGTISARGGALLLPGGAGTVFTKSSSQTDPVVLVDNSGAPGVPTLLSSPGPFVLLITNGGVAYPQGPLTLTSVTIGSNGILTHIPGQTGLVVTVLGNATIDQGGKISVIGKGYGSGSASGPGVGQSGNYAGGGGYGGVGGTGFYGLAGGGTYGSILQPVDLGSGGGNGNSANTGGAGGGALRLVVNGVLTVNGIVTADGAPVVEHHGGGGSGGSLWMTVGTLAGAGGVSANGGNGTDTDGGGGGGGRVAIYYSGNSFTGQITARGGFGNQYGGAGTVYMNASTAAAGNLILDNGNNVGPSTPLSTPVPFSLTIANKAIVHAQGPLTVGNLSIRTNAILSHGAGQSGLDLTVLTNATIEAGGRLDVSGKGYAGGNGPGAGQNGNYGGGGSYGGIGGTGYYGLLGGMSYGSAIQPTDFGSGGGNWNHPGAGGPGGGAVRMVVNGNLTVDGVLAADGGPVGEQHGGGGAGGSLWLTVGVFSGTGLVSANGGSAVATDGGGGGGGRVAVYFGSSAFNGVLSAHGGFGNEHGGAGTVYTCAKSATVGDLLIENGNNVGPTTPFFAPIPLNLTVSGNSAAYPQAALTLSSITIKTNGVMTHWAGQPGLELVVLGDATIEAGGRMDVTGKGYAAGVGPGRGQDGNYAGGGGYGGAGAPGYYGVVGGGIYGSSNQPVDLGSGGGNFWTTSISGGSGGGAVHVVVTGALTLNGVLSADGGSVVEQHGGAGSGGSVWIETGTLAGNGRISAVGGQAIPTDGGGGGGGRIAIYSINSTYTGIVSVDGGSGNATGAAGTIYRTTSMPSQFAGVWSAFNGTVRPWADFVDVVFTSAINPATFTPADVVFTTPFGTNISTSQLTVSNIGGRVWRIGFPHQTANGHYQFQVGTQIQALFGATMATGCTGAFDISQTNWPPRVLSASTGLSLTVTTPSIAGMSYQLLTSLDLVHWQLCGAVKVGDGNPLAWPVSMADSSGGFYRLTMY